MVKHACRNDHTPRGSRKNQSRKRVKPTTTDPSLFPAAAARSPPPSLPPLPSFLRYQKNGPVSQTPPSPSLSFLLAPSAASDRKGEEGRLEETLPRATRPNGGGDRQQGDFAPDGPFVRSLDDSTAVFLVTQRRSSRTQKEERDRTEGAKRKGATVRSDHFRPLLLLSRCTAHIYFAKRVTEGVEAAMEEGGKESFCRPHSPAIKRAKNRRWKGLAGWPVLALGLE